MEPQTLIHRPLLHPPISLVQASRKLHRSAISPSVCSPIRPAARISLHSDTLLAKGKLQCAIRVDKIERKDVCGTEKSKPEAKLIRKKLAVFVSGGGSLISGRFMRRQLTGLYWGDIVVLVTNNRDCGGAEYARENGIPVIVFPSKTSLQEVFSAQGLVDALSYLKLIPTKLIQAYPKAILNIHPSLLPAFGGKGFYGMKVHKAVIASGARYSGSRIHYVDEQYDTGHILAQRVVPVLMNDTAEALAARVLREEHKLYVEVSQALCEDRITWRQDGIPVIRSPENPGV